MTVFAPNAKELEEGGVQTTTGAIPEGSEACGVNDAVADGTPDTGVSCRLVGHVIVGAAY